MRLQRWNIRRSDGTHIGVVYERIAEKGKEPDEYARCAAIVQLNIPSRQEFSASPADLTWDELLEMQL